MTKPKRRKPSGRPRPVNLGPGRRHLLIATVVVAVGIVAAAALLRGRELGGLGSPPPSLAAPGMYQAPTDASPTSAFQALHGRWLRPDSGYILDIRHVGDSGTIEAAYLNPRPIPVARAKAMRDGSTLNIFVELRAPGYPGSTYTLTYDPKGDQLAGTYFQAALQQHFDVVFVRMR
jgi:hypothetical protein